MLMDKGDQRVREASTRLAEVVAADVRELRVNRALWCFRVIAVVGRSLSGRFDLY